MELRAKVRSVEERQKDIARTSAIGLTVPITHLILPTAPLHVFFRSIGFLASSARRRAIRAFSVCDISAWPSGVVSTGRGSDEGKRGSGTVDCMGPLESGTIEGLVDSSARESSPSVGISGGLLGMAMFDDTVIVK